MDTALTITITIILRLLPSLSLLLSVFISIGNIVVMACISPRAAVDNCPGPSAGVGKGVELGRHSNAMRSHAECGPVAHGYGASAGRRTRRLTAVFAFLDECLSLCRSQLSRHINVAGDIRKMPGTGLSHIGVSLPVEYVC